MITAVRNVVDAFLNTPPNYLKSIFGTPDTWVDTHKFSEFNLASNDLLKFIKYSSEVTLPPLLGDNYFLKAFVPTFLQSLLFMEHASIFEVNMASNADKFADEKWFFINGIVTNEDLAAANGKYISLLFQRAVTVLHNPTNGIGLDMMQYVNGKFGQNNLEFAKYVMPTIRKALEEKNKVVLISHSQGTLIASTILDLLIQENNRNLGKLEIYAFANCAVEMSHQVIEEENNKPLIESFSNEYDVVAKLGVLHPNKEERGIQIDGEHFIKKDGWGHFLNIHYLRDFAEGKYIDENGKKESRLFSYITK
ncbi:MAG: hypothetical protein SFU27_09355 [Thermonemataceae bacterium]|nr:hypothetical protein [Thermonemataceae bacterium]